MSEVFRVALSLSLSGAVLIIIVAVCCRLLGERLSKRWQYYIWLLVVVRLLIPFAPEAGVIGTIFGEASPAATSYTGGMAAGWESEITGPTLYENRPDAVAPPVIPGAPPEQAPPVSESAGIQNAFLNFLLGTWLLVAVILFVRKVTLYQSFVKYVKAGKTEVSDPAILNLLGDISEQIGIKRPVELYVNSLISSPIIMGFFKPVIVLPSMPASEIELRHICVHELIHYKRGDIFYKWLLQVALCLHWFNPLVHWMVREANRACELSCDEGVVHTLKREEIMLYGDTLLESLKTPGQYHEGIAALTLSENASRLKERLEAIKMSERAGKGRAVIATTLTFGILIAGWVVLGAYFPGGLRAQSPEPLAPASSLYDFEPDYYYAPDDPEQDDHEQDDHEQGDPEQDDHEQDDPGQDYPEQDDSGQDDPGQDDPEQDDSGQDDPGQDDPGQDGPEQAEQQPQLEFMGENPFVMPQQETFTIMQAFELNGFTPSRLAIENVQFSFSPSGSDLWRSTMSTDQALIQAAWETLSRMEVQRVYNIPMHGTLPYDGWQPRNIEVSSYQVTIDFQFPGWLVGVEMFGPVHILGRGPFVFAEGSSAQPLIDLFSN